MLVVIENGALIFHPSLQGKKVIRKHATLGARKSSDMRSRLEDMIMGQNYSNRSEMLSRRGKGGNFTVL